MTKPFRLFLALAAFASPAGAQTLPPPVMQARKEAIEACESGKVTFGPNYIQTADFNGDGELDYVLDDGGLECKGGVNPNCGSGGCSVEVYVSTPQGYRSADLQRLAFKASIVRKAGKPPILVLVGRHGTDRYRWNGSKFQPINATAAESYKIDKKGGGKLFTTTAPIDVVAQPKEGAKKLASYQAGAIMAVIGEAKGTGYLYVSPCNACDSGFVPKAEFLSKAKEP